jgi:hypothetical protein
MVFVHQVLCAALAASSDAMARSYTSRNAASAIAASSVSREIMRTIFSGLWAVARHNP